MLYIEPRGSVSGNGRKAYGRRRWRDAAGLCPSIHILPADSRDGGSAHRGSRIYICADERGKTAAASGVVFW